jgi:hypothetical protein
MTIALDRVPLDEINSRARQVQFGRTLLTLLAAALYLLGWLAAKVAGGLWLACAWVAVAVRVGWTEARAGGTTRGPG